MINKIYTYGCSFSFHFWINENETYTSVLKDYLKCDFKNSSFPALCNEEIYHRFLNDIQFFKSDDLIIYQFTSGYREGFIFPDKDNFYYSTAGLKSTVKETITQFNEWGGGREKYPFTDNQLNMLIDFTNNWSEYKIYHRYERVNKLLEYLSKTIGFKYVFLFLDNSFDKFIDSKNVIKFDEKHYSIMDWLIQKKIRLSDFRSMPFKDDCHPSAIAHKEIANKISNFLSI